MKGCRKGKSRGCQEEKPASSLKPKPRAWTDGATQLKLSKPSHQKAFLSAKATTKITSHCISMPLATLRAGLSEAGILGAFSAWEKSCEALAPESRTRQCNGKMERESFKVFKVLIRFIQFHVFVRLRSWSGHFWRQSFFLARLLNKKRQGTIQSPPKDDPLASDTLRWTPPSDSSERLQQCFGLRSV